MFKQKFKGSVAALSNVYVLVFSSILVAISVTGKMFAFNIGLDIRISYENLPTVMSGIIFGPLVGFAVGICSDLCGCLAVGYAVNPVITLGAGLIGLTSGTVSLLFKKKYSPIPLLVSDVSGHLVGSLIVKTAGIAWYYGAANGIWALFISRVITYLPVIAFEYIVFLFLLGNKFMIREINSILSKGVKRRGAVKKEEEAMTYEKALEYIHSVCWKGSRPGLSRITELCHRLGDPQNDLKFVHVTGTNGKGSTCAMTESVLRAAGYKTGLFTSPYVKVFNERMAVNGENVSNERLAEVTALVKPHADAMEDSPTEFELITAIAFVLFKLEKCDIVVLEAGMGGRLDSTNVISGAEVSVITGVALEHTEYLGDTVPKIANEKAGIIKKGCPVVYGGRDYGQMISPENEKTAFAVISERAAELGCELSFCDYGALNVKSATLEGATLDYKERKDVKIPLLGLYQPENCVKALEVIEALKKKGYNIPDSAVAQGLGRVVWRARFEKLLAEPFTLYDGSHNPEGIGEAVKTLKHYFGERKLNFLTGVMRDKDYSYMANMLSPLANEVFCITPDNPRSLSSEELMKVYSGFGVRSSAFSTVADGVKAAVEKSRGENVPLICLGSLYMYAEVSEAIEKL